ncbi:MAG TPA: hypothetical protein VE291_00360 [Terracidiphilus sp.]|jgi:hypothetical protein|nr:hypothetical protein [Terracidiphilus sp.]
MHFNFAFNTIQVLWAITFAALLTLLVVLLGRDRAHRFPWFTASISMVTLSLLVNRLLYGRLAQIPMAVVSIVLSDLTAILALLVLVEMARRVFGKASRRAWMAGTLGLLIAGGIVLGTWGVWPHLKSLKPFTLFTGLGMLQLLAQKLGLLTDVMSIGLALLVVLLGRRFGAGWRSHAQRIVIGLATASISQLAWEAIWQIVAEHTHPHSMDEYQHVLGLKEKLFNGNKTIYAVVIVWWIVCLWINEPENVEPASTAPALEEAPAETPQP